MESKIENLFESTLSYLGGFYSCFNVLKNSCCEYKNLGSIKPESVLFYLIVEYGLLEELNPKKKKFLQSQKRGLKRNAFE
ncbi:MAG: hypothetical protein ACP5H9_04490 [Candidatus Woesearchaeota archaeon]